MTHLLNMSHEFLCLEIQGAEWHQRTVRIPILEFSSHGRKREGKLVLNFRPQKEAQPQENEENFRRSVIS